MMRSMASWCWNMHTYIHKSGHGAGVFICFLCSCAYSSTSIWVLIGKHDRPNAPGIWDHGIPSRLECGHSQVHLGFSTWEETIKGYLGIWLTRQGDLIGFNDQSLWFNGGLTIRCFFLVIYPSVSPNMAAEKSYMCDFQLLCLITRGSMWCELWPI